MNREQAINYLFYSGFSEEQINTIEQAFKQAPTTKNDLGVDCISREQTQTEIEMNASRYTIARERGGMGQVEWSDQLIKVSDAVDIIRNLPSVTPQEPRKGHWIPVSERLPEEDGEYCAIVYDTDDNYKYMDIAELEDGIWQYKDYVKVLAWMPLPKPYEPQESEGKG